MEDTLRKVGDKEYTHDRLGKNFEHALNRYDTERRVEVLVDEFLGSHDLKGKRVLDVGCGLGYFSKALKKRGAEVTACDLGPNMVRLTKERVGCDGTVADALDLTRTFEPESFDFVVSSECIEHTPDPAKAVAQMIRVLKPGGYISLSTPNVLWYPLVKFASVIKFRPFDGYENFSTWPGLRKTFEENGVKIVKEKGLHFFPFQLRLNRLSTWMDENLQALRGMTINICIFGQKKG